MIGVPRGGVWSVGVCGLLWLIVTGSAARAQEVPPVEDEPAGTEATPAPPRQVGVQPLAEDREIAARLQRILDATDWFINPQVRVDEGVVFLRGQTRNEEHKIWARQLAQNTQDVVAVVDRIEVLPRPIWDLSPAYSEFNTLWRNAIQISPFVLLALLLLAVSWFIALAAARGSRNALRTRIENRLLREVTARTIAILVFVLGLYLVLRISGLTRLALTVVGGTGVVGIVVGIAFRDIAENFLASILISMQNPFHTGDLIEVTGHRGFVQRVTTRGTVLMALDGTYIQIPNSTIYKNTILNTTANPKTRQEFSIGIGYDDAIAYAQQLAIDVMHKHPAVLKDPEPLVLVDNLGASTVNLRVLFWINSNAYSLLRVRSSVMRVVKRAFQDAEITMPDEAREVVFPQGVPIQMLDGDGGPPKPHRGAPSAKTSSTPAEAEPAEEVSTPAEGDLRNEASEIEEQVRHSRMPESGADLLAPDGGAK